MPTVDKLTQSDIDTINKLKTGQISGLLPRLTPSVLIAGQNVVAVDTSLKPDLFIAKETKKRKIVIHATVGLLASDLPTLTSQKQMTTHYIVARDGTIIEVYPPKYWAFHLGKGAIGGNGAMSQESIAIEVSNYGPLELKNKGDKANPADDKFYTVYGSLYGSGNEKVDAKGFVGGGNPSVTKLLNAYRGYKYYASITEAQYSALNALVTALCNKFAIPLSTIEYENRFKVFENDQKAKDFQGICSHVNFRPSGKWDLSAWCDWDKITTQSDSIEWEEASATEEPEGNPEGIRVLKEEKFDGTDDNWEYTDTIDPISGAVIETAENKKMRILRENNPLICAF